MDDITLNQVSPTDQPATRVVTISGSMTIRHGAEIKAALVKALTSAETLLLDLEEVTEIDLIGLQFVCSTHRAAMAHGKRFSVKETDNQAITAAVIASGFTRHTGCIQDIEHTCIWAGRGK